MSELESGVTVRCLCNERQRPMPRGAVVISTRASEIGCRERTIAFARELMDAMGITVEELCSGQSVMMVGRGGRESAGPQEDEGQVMVSPVMALGAGDPGRACTRRVIV